MSFVKPIFLGILAAFFALVLEISFSIVSGRGALGYLSAGISLTLVFSAFAEELSKYSVIYKGFSALKSRFQVLFSGLMVGLGFAAVELYFNYYNRGSAIFSPPWALAGILIIHLFTAGFSAWVVSNKENVYFTTARALIFNTLVHVLYNLAIIYLT